MRVSGWIGWGMLLGVALAGFFDGILLHQILQWHHLLSLVRGMADLRVQVLWDGYFHGLMYVLAAAALVGLWRRRQRGDPRRMLAAVLLGFGAWQVVDAALFHWLLGIHRIRVDSEDPLAWDLGWLAAFGLVPLLIGFWLMGWPKNPSRLGASAAVVLLAAATGLAAVWALWPPPPQAFATVVFRPGLRPDQVFAALAHAEARLVSADGRMGIVVADVPPGRRWTLYRHGALLVSGAGLPAGCLDWTRS
jgi:uncharacterized membrane protein